MLVMDFGLIMCQHKLRLKCTTVLGEVDGGKYTLVGGGVWEISDSFFFFFGVKLKLF